MKKLESSLMNMVLVLTLVAVIMGGILAYVNHLTEGPMAQQKEKALADGITAVMGFTAVPTEDQDTNPTNLFCGTMDEKGKVKSGMGWSVGEIGYNQAGEISRLTIIQHERKEADKVVFDWTKEEKTAPPKQEKKSAYGLVRDLIKGSEYKFDDVTAFIQENFGENIRINDLTAEQFKKVYAAYYHSIKGAVWDGKTYA